MGLLVVVVIATVGAGLTRRAWPALRTALRHAAFNVVSVVTTTGFATATTLLWGNAAIGLFFGLTFVGGCTGSTAAG